MPAHSYRKGLMLTVGQLINATVDVVTVLSPPRTQLKRLCREHHEPVKQRNYCEAGEHFVEWGEWDMGRRVGNDWQVAPADKRPEQPKSEAIEFVPIPKSEFSDHAVYGGGFYYLKPSSEAAGAGWAILSAMTDEYALVGSGNLRQGNPKLFSLEKFRDYLVMREVTFPEYIKETPETPDVEVDNATLALALQYAGNVTSSWEDINTTDVGAARFEEWVTSGTTLKGPDAPVPTGAASNLMDDLKAALEKAVNSK